MKQKTLPNFLFFLLFLLVASCFFGCASPQTENTEPTTVPNLPQPTTQAASETTALNVKTYSNGLSFTSHGDGTCEVSGIGACEDAKIVIPPTSPDGDRVIGIAPLAFRQSNTLIEIEIPEGVVNISDAAFENCPLLQTVILPQSIQTIGDAFNECPSLAFNRYDNAEYLGNEQNPYLLLVKAKDQTIDTCTVHPNVKLIHHRAFEFCMSLSEIDLPDSILSIGDFAFQGCKSLPTIILPKGLRALGDYVFSDCYSLTDIEIPIGVSRIGHSAFSDCMALQKITLPQKVERIGMLAFFRCTSLSEIEIPNKNCVIEDDAYETFPRTTVLRGKAGSTIEAYAKKHNRVFVPRDE